MYDRGNEGTEVRVLLLRINWNEFGGVFSGFQVAEVPASTASHQQGPWFETGRANPSLFAQTDREYCAHLLYIFYYIWHFGCSGE
jgi:hypothetical protein